MKLVNISLQVIGLGVNSAFDFAKNAGHEVIGFTDFAYEVAEGSKSEIFRRCDAGASNENGQFRSEE